MSRRGRILDLDEPSLEFGYGQAAHHPKDGLFMFGPVQTNRNPARMDVGVVGTPEGIRRYSAWVERINRMIPAATTGKEANNAMWPGFQAVFNATWPSKPYVALTVDEDRLHDCMHESDRHQGIYGAVQLYADALRKHLHEDGSRPGVWFVVLPEFVYTFGRPKSKVPAALKVRSKPSMGRKTARKIIGSGTLFEEEREAAALYEYELNFHNQLKIRILDTKCALQIVRETTLAPDEYPEDSRRSLQDPASVAWNLATTSFYKSDGQPWRIANIRDGVCYVGLVFKKLDSPKGNDNACCGAQMFLTTGDGVVFRGAPGPWYIETENRFHLSAEQAGDLARKIVAAYRERHHGRDPGELFIHGKIRFDAEEWRGFREAVPETTKLVGIQIRDQKEIKLFRYGKNPVLRGTALIESDRLAHLWTRGYVPRLETYPGREVPNPLTIEIRQGEADIEVVLRDVLALTKVNFNNAQFSDGLPVTLRFADQVGEILTAGPMVDDAPLPFKFYI